MTGRVKNLRDSYGFITADGGGDFFFHESDQADDFELRVGDRVAFEPVEPQPPRGPRARSVAFVEEAGRVGGAGS